MEFGILLRLKCDDPHNYFILSVQYLWERAVLMWFHSKNFNIGLYSDIYRQISFKHGIIIETSKFYILISVWMTLTFIQEIKSFGIHFLADLSIDLDEIQYVATSC